MTVDPAVDPRSASLSFWASVSHFPCYGQSLCTLNRTNFVFPKGNMSFSNRVRAFRLLSWTLKKREDKNVQEQGSLGHLRLWGHLEAVCVLTRITGVGPPGREGASAPNSQRKAPAPNPQAPAAERSPRYKQAWEARL